MTQLLQEKTRHTNSYPATVRASMVCVTKSAMRAPELSASKTNEKFHQCQSNSATTGFYFVRFFLQTEQKYKISFPQNYMVRYPCYVRKKFDSWAAAVKNNESGAVFQHPSATLWIGHTLFFENGMLTDYRSVRYVRKKPQAGKHLRMHNLKPRWPRICPVLQTKGSERRSEWCWCGK